MTLSYDDYLLAATDDGARPLVVLGAGLDTRAHRIAWPPDTRLLEFDQPPMLAYRQAVPAEHAARAECDRIAVGVDLRDD